jgi:hypothetical protein
MRSRADVRVPGFALTQPLVVAATIAVLAPILFPTISRAPRKARQIGRSPTSGGRLGRALVT